MGCRAITVQGDSYDPGGIISGGSTNGMNWLREYCNAAQVGVEADRIVGKARQYDQLDAQLNEFLTQSMSLGHQNNEINARLERMKRSGYHRGVESIDELQKQIDEKMREIAVNQDKVKKSKETIKEYGDIVKSMNSGSGDNEKRKVEMKKELEVKKNELRALAGLCEQLRGESEDLEENLKDFIDANTNLKTDLASVTARLVELESLLANALQTSTQCNEDQVVAQKEMDRFLKAHQEEERKLNALKAEIVTSENNIKSFQTQISALKAHVKELDTAIVDSQAAIQAALKANLWIKNDEPRFNVPNTEYDFSEKTTATIQESLERESTKLTTLKKFNDPLCIEELDQLEADYKDKMAKLNGVKVDRDAIKKSIAMLDLKKTETVENTFKVVNRYFGQIFSILLPGAQSRLKPHRSAAISSSKQDGEDNSAPVEGPLVGCEMQVAFNGKWKESLSELSGGQRSLLALSLILALLRCKPAPLYILDEVDAALDASHTQNIGKTIKEHFEQSQFIIVSLKEGMFENANILVRTQLGPNGSQISVSRRGGTE